MRHAWVPVLAVAAVVAGLLAWALTGEGEEVVPGDLVTAVEAGDAGLAAAHLRRGADPDQPDRRGSTPLMKATAQDDPDLVQVLLDGGADPDRAGRIGLAPLHVAAEVDGAEVMALLLDAGADPARRTRSGHAPLHVAAAAGSTAVVPVLVAAGVDPDQPSGVVTQGHGYPRDRGATPLGVAAWSDQAVAVEALLAVGAAVDAPSTSGHTPLLLAVFGDAEPAVLRTLLDAGADRTAEAACTAGCSGERLDVAGWAQELGRTDLLGILEP